MKGIGGELAEWQTDRRFFWDLDRIHPPGEHPLKPNHKRHADNFFMSKAK